MFFSTNGTMLTYSKNACLLQFAWHFSRESEGTCKTSSRDVILDARKKKKEKKSRPKDRPHAENL